MHTKIVIADHVHMVFETLLAKRNSLLCDTVIFSSTGTNVDQFTSLGIYLPLISCRCPYLHNGNRHNSFTRGHIQRMPGHDFIRFAVFDLWANPICVSQTRFEKHPFVVDRIHSVRLLSGTSFSALNFHFQGEFLLFAIHTLVFF